MPARAIVLAAGKGTRMKSATPKVLHEVCGRPLLWYVIDALRTTGVDEIVVVTNTKLESRIGDFGVKSVVQHEQLGTGHALKVALEALEPREGRLLVASGDMPLVPADVFSSMLTCLDDGSAMALVTVKMPLPSNFGRIVRNGDRIERIVEVRDANIDELAIDEMNAAVYGFDEHSVREALPHLRNDNAQGEYYITDTVAHFVQNGKAVRPVLHPDHADLLGINDRTELALARKTMNQRLCAHHMREGVTIIDPDTTYLEPELTIGRDTVIYPGTIISRLSEIGDGCAVGPHARLSNATLRDRATVCESVIFDSEIGEGASVGPYAHIRGGAVLGDNVHIGNFVEVKKSQLAPGVKAGHLSYLGDATIGERTNIGAGTITCNYDGVKKNKTVIGAGVFIGSNSSLVAPVAIGDNALTGAGAVVIRDVPENARVVGNPAKPLPAKKA